jgi:hypothetical protein
VLRGDSGMARLEYKATTSPKKFGDVSRLRTVASIINFMFVIINKSITDSFCQYNYFYILSTCKKQFVKLQSVTKVIQKFTKNYRSTINYL